MATHDRPSKRHCARMSQDWSKAVSHPDDGPSLVEGLGRDTGAVHAQDPSTHAERDREYDCLDRARRTGRPYEVQRSAFIAPRAFVQGDKPVFDKTVERKIRSLQVLLGDVTPQRARAYGFDYSRWLKSTEDAIRVDYPKITELGKRIASRLERGSRVHVTSKLGTDIRFDVSKRPVHVQDGIVDEEDMARGLVSTQLPSGKVEVAPIETSGRGTVVFDTPKALKGRLIADLQLIFEKGRVREFHAKRYEDVFREVFEATQGDKDSIGHFAIGLNPKIELIGYPSDELALGTATIGIGANKGNGGLNDSSFEFSGTLTKPTIDIDGTALMVDGRLVL